MKKTKEPAFFSNQVAQARRFYIQKSNAKDSRIKVVCGGCEHTTPDFKIDRKDFPYYCVEFVAKGSGFVTLNNRKYELNAGTIFSYGPGISQRITSVPEEPMIKYFIAFTGSSVKQILKKHIPPGTAIHISRPYEITRILDDLLTHGLSDSPYKTMICSIILEYLLYRIAEMAISEKTGPSGAFLTYQNCRQYIKDNFLTLNSLKDIADACMIDHAYLCRLFKQFDTQSPYQYLLNLKMTYAADRFQKTGVLVKKVARELGFVDQFHFTRVFKKVFGIPPQSFKGLR
ncbi:MAG: AraC family transcriptional regulator [Sedimentisphaerales bacterium]|jgi:AraC-like DNA-binding protein